MIVTLLYMLTVLKQLSNIVLSLDHASVIERVFPENYDHDDPEAKRYVDEQQKVVGLMGPHKLLADRQLVVAFEFKQVEGVVDEGEYQ